jgi:hypothetical protein
MALEVHNDVTKEPIVSDSDATHFSTTVYIKSSDDTSSNPQKLGSPLIVGKEYTLVITQAIAGVVSDWTILRPPGIPTHSGGNGDILASGRGTGTFKPDVASKKGTSYLISVLSSLPGTPGRESIVSRVSAVQQNSDGTGTIVVIVSITVVVLITIILASLFAAYMRYGD